MKIVLAACVLIAKFYLFVASPQSNCKIIGADNGSRAYYTIKKPIIDSYNGIIATFNTSNIKEIITQNSEYLEATLNSNILNIHTNKNYSNLKFEFKDSNAYGAGIEIEILFKCIAENGSEYDNTYIFKQESIDINGAPKFNQDIYEYTLGMAIPEDYKLNKLNPIMATFDRYSYGKKPKEEGLYFLLEFNEYFRVSYNVKASNKIEYYPSLEALQEIKAPFHQTFKIMAMDRDEEDAKKSFASVKINVYEHITPSIPGTPTPSHPPVFSKYLYYANYTESNKLNMNEVISIKYGVQDGMIVTQSDYEDYIKVELYKNDPELINVEVIKPLPDNLIKSLDMLTIEIKAINENINIAGRTALIIRLPGDNKTITEVISNGNNFINFTYSNTPVIMLTTGMMFIIFLNIMIVTWHFYKKRSSW